MKTSIRYQMMKQQRIGVFLLIFFIVIVEFLLHFDTLFATEKYVAASNQLVALQRKLQVENNNNHYHFYNSIKLYNFNPNEFSANDWQNFGFSEKQAVAIIKYKNIVGGKFTSKEQLKKCFVINEEKYKELEKYIQLPKNQDQITDLKLKNSQITNTKKSLQPFNPNDLDEQGWIELGFSPKQVGTILRYKNSLGGKFASKEQLKKCYVISQEKFNELLPFIVLE